MQLIWKSATDLDAVIPTVLQYDPPMPASDALAKYLHPELFVIRGDEIFELCPFALRDASRSLLTYWEPLWNYTASLYTGGLCPDCRRNQGTRSDVPLELTYPDTTTNGGWVRASGLGNSIYLFSEHFLELLTDDERARLHLRQVARPPRSRRTFYELIGPSGISYVSVHGYDAEGLRCKSCGRATGSYLHGTEPLFRDNDIRSFVCRDDLPNPLLDLFVVGGADEPILCVTRARWDQMRQSKSVTGILATRLGVVPASECDRDPRLPTGEKCTHCSDWICPSGRRHWYLPAPELHTHPTMLWLEDALQNNRVQCTREELTFDQIWQLIGQDAPPKTPRIFSFRCPHCWRLGRITVQSCMDEGRRKCSFGISLQSFQ